MKKKSKKKVVLIVILSLIIVIGVAATVIIYRIFNPKNLGIKASKEAYDSAITKLDILDDSASYTGNPKDYVLKNGEPKEVDAKLTSEEVTSLFYYSSNESIKDVQIRVNKDDTVDFSGVVNKEYFLTKMLNSTSEDDILKAVPALKYIPDNIAVYSNFSGEVIDNEVSEMSINKVTVMGFGLPESLYKTIDTESVFDSLLSSITSDSGSLFDSIKLEDGNMILKGKLSFMLTKKDENN